MRLYLYLFLSIFLICGCEERNIVVSPGKVKYKFAVAGHAYGSYHENNPALYQKFLDLFKPQAMDYSFIVFAGDQIRDAERENADILISQLDQLGVPYFLTRGNHDGGDYLYEKFKEKYGGTYYSFIKENEKIIVLDCIEDNGDIADDQLSFFKQEIETLGKSVKNVFIVVHELIWTVENDKFKDVKHNMGVYERGNFWARIYPLLSSANKKINFYIVAGDVGGGRDRISAYYEKLGNITLLATGMGETVDENFMEVFITVDGKAVFNLVPLNSWAGRVLRAIARVTELSSFARVNLKNIEEY